MSKIILCRGLQGSGKSFYAKQWVLEDPEHRVRFNNVDIRNMLGKYWVPNREVLVSNLKKEFINSAMSLGYDIIIDNMNLNPKEIKYFQDLVDDWNNPTRILPDIVRNTYEIVFKDFFISLQECIDRDSKRENPVGEKVIRETYNKYKDIIEIGIFNSIQNN